MFSFILTVMVLGSVLACAAEGRPEAGNALMEGSAEAVRFCLSAAGPLCLWSGVLELLERCGGTEKLSAAMKPVLGRLFPRASADRDAFDALSENVCANLLGLGNAATPAGIRAVQRMNALGPESRDELSLFVVLNTASIQLLPTTIASVRAAAGAAAPFDVLPAVLLSSLCSVSAGLLAATFLRRIWR